MGRKRKTNKKGERGKTDRERERKRGRKRQKENGDFPGFSTVETPRSEKKIRSMHCGLRVGTKIFEFRQTL